MVEVSNRFQHDAAKTSTGKVVRIGPNRISVNSHQALQDIYSVTANVQKSNVYGTFKHFFGNIDMSMTMINRKAHAARRRVTVQPLTAPKVKLMEDKILNDIRIFCESLASEDADSWSQPRDVTMMVSYLVFDIMGDLTFSKNWNLLLNEENRPLAEEVPMGVAGIHIVGS